MHDLCINLRLGSQTKGYALPCRVVLQRRREERKRKRAEEEATKPAEEDKDSKEAAKEEVEVKKAKPEDAVKQEVSLLSVHAGGKIKVRGPMVVLNDLSKAPKQDVSLLRMCAGSS